MKDRIPCKGAPQFDPSPKPSLTTLETCKALVAQGKHTKWGGAIAGAIEDFAALGTIYCFDLLTEAVRNQDKWRREAELQLTAKCP